MDGVSANYYGGFLKTWRAKYPDRAWVPPENVTDFYIENLYPEEYKNDILEITRSKDHFLNLEPLEGAIEALKAIAADEEFNSFLCTAPDLDYDYQMCWTEKALWILEHLDRGWASRTIITKDKTLIGGDFLIDDKPIIKGVNSSPSWERVVFDQPYNKGATGLRLNSWNAEDWGLVREEMLRKHYDN